MGLAKETPRRLFHNFKGSQIIKMATQTPKISDLVVAAYLEKNAPKTVVTGFKKSKGIKQAKLDEYDHLQAMLELATKMKTSLPESGAAPKAESSSDDSSSEDEKDVKTVVAAKKVAPKPEDSDSPSESEDDVPMKDVSAKKPPVKSTPAKKK